MYVLNVSSGRHLDLGNDLTPFLYAIGSTQYRVAITITCAALKELCYSAETFHVNQEVSTAGPYDLFRILMKENVWELFESRT